VTFGFFSGMTVCPLILHLHHSDMLSESTSIEQAFAVAFHKRLYEAMFLSVCGNCAKSTSNMREAQYFCSDTHITTNSVANFKLVREVSLL